MSHASHIIAANGWRSEKNVQQNQEWLLIIYVSLRKQNLKEREGWRTNEAGIWYMKLSKSFWNIKI